MHSPRNSFQSNIDTSVKKNPIKIDIDKAYRIITTIFLWILFVILSAISPIITHWSFRANNVQVQDKIITSTITDMSFLISLLLAQFFSFIFYGYQELKLCYDIKYILKIFPISTSYAIAETLNIISLTDMSPSIYIIFIQTRLILSTLISCFFFKRMITSTQIGSTLSITASIIAFLTINSNSCLDFSKVSTKSLTVLIIFILLTTVAASACDYLYKQIPYKPTTIIALGRITAFPMSLLVTLFICWKNNLWKYKYFGGNNGWDYKIIILTIWFVICDWTTTLVLRNLDVVTKCIGSAVSIILTYILDVVIFDRKSHLAPIATIFSIMFCIILFAKENQLSSHNIKLKKLESIQHNSIVI